MEAGMMDIDLKGAMGVALWWAAVALVFAAIALEHARGLL